MSIQNLLSKRHFTDAARAAAVDARRRKREAALPKNRPEVFVVRKPPAHLVFGWEIRRFGAVVLEKGDTDFATMQEARTAGERALSAFRADA